jgi:cell division transport system permease protein
MIVRPPSAPERRLLPEGRLAGPMPWVIAIMMFLTVLAAAGGLGLAHAARGLTARLAGGITIQIVDANPDRREAAGRAVVARLAADPHVVHVHRVDAEEMAQLLRPWLGQGGLDPDLPVPVLIDADLGRDGRSGLPAIAADLARIAPAARIDDQSRWLLPLAGLIATLKWLAAAVVVMMAFASGATVTLAARGALNTHRPTIDVLHMLGATDKQVARLFQRRIALDAMFGGVTGFVAAIAVILVLGNRLAAVGSELLASSELDWLSWLLLALVPLLGAALALAVARSTVLAALRRMP